jgi:hypothetical protein
MHIKTTPCGFFKSTSSIQGTSKKYEDAMTTLWKEECHCPEDSKTLPNEETKELLHLHHLGRQLLVPLQFMSFPKMMIIGSSYS